MFFTEGFYGHDDALYGAARLLRIVADSGRTVSRAARRRAEVRLDAGDPRGRAPRSASSASSTTRCRHFRRTHDVIDVDGVRVLFGDGWGLIRASNTQPVLVMRFEALTEARRDAIRAEMEGWLRAQGIDPTPGVGH